MEIITSYVAEDGTKFDSEQKCRDYESLYLYDNLFKNKIILLWDEDFEPTIDYKNSQYMYVPDLKAKDKFNAWCKSKGFYNLLDKSGAYYYYNPRATWMPFASLYQWVIKFLTVLPEDYFVRLD